MSLIYEVSVMALAAGRVSYSLTKDEIFRPVREAIWRRSSPLYATNIQGEPWRMIECWKHNEQERARGWGKWSEEFDPQSLREPGFFGRLVECANCLSFWVSLVIAIAYMAFGDVVVTLLAPLALWALANTYASKAI